MKPVRSPGSKPLVSEPLALDTTVPVLVFKLGSYAIHHGTLGIIRSLGRLGVPVYATVEDRYTPAAMSRYLTGAFVWRTRGLDSDSILNGMAAIGRRLGRTAILVPTDDSAAAFVAEQSGALGKWFLFPRPPNELPRRLSNKTLLYSLCKSIRAPCPDAMFPRSIDDVRAVIEHGTFPVVVKAADARRLPAGGSSTSIARTPKELLALYQREQSPEQPNLILQEYIPESCGEDWIVHGYCNPQTGCLILFTGRKWRSYPPFAGPTVLGEAIPDETLRLQTEKMLKAIGYAGILDLDYRLDKRDGQYKLLDFNPRIGANFRMFEDLAGVDVVRALHLDLTGRHLRRFPAVTRKFIVEPYDVLASLDYMRRGKLTLRSWWKSLEGQKEIAWFHGDDPVPFLVMCVRLLLRVLGRPFRFQRKPRPGQSHPPRGGTVLRKKAAINSGRT